MWPFTSKTGWRTIKGREGFTVEMPCKHTHRESSSIKHGQLPVSRNASTAFLMR